MAPQALPPWTSPEGPERGGQRAGGRDGQQARDRAIQVAHEARTGASASKILKEHREPRV
jgi:hypothetical protein